MKTSTKGVVVVVRARAEARLARRARRASADLERNSPVDRDGENANGEIDTRTSARALLDAQLAAERAKAAITLRAAKSEVARARRAKEEREKAEEAKVEDERRARAAKEALEVGGRGPWRRAPGPLAASGVACVGMAVCAFEGVVRGGDFILNYDGASGVAKQGVLSLVVGVGLVLASVAAFSACLLFAFAFNETKGVVLNEPIIYYRCDGCDKSCCVNGPHNLGYHERFTYLANGRGFETREAASMRRHLRVSKDCRALKPLIVYPKDAGWGFW